MKQLKTVFLSILTLTLLTQCREESRFYTNVQRSQVFFQAYDETKYDFLWVVDNSPSMLPRRQFVRDNMQGFLNILNSRKAIDYQMAMTSTDMMTDFGNLISGTAGLKVVKSTSSNPASDFAGIINNANANGTPVDTSFWEQPLESMYQALFNHKSQFMRAGVPLIIIIITDSDDWSCQSNCFGVQPENNTNWVAYPVSRYIDYLNALGSANNSDVSVFPITGTTEEDCGYEFVGAKMIQLQQAIGNYGKTGSICPSKLSASYNGIAQVIADRGAVFKLEYPATGKAISVYIAGQLIPNAPENYIFDSATNSIIFTGVFPKKGENVEILYNQVEK